MYSPLSQYPFLSAIQGIGLVTYILSYDKINTVYLGTQVSSDYKIFFSESDGICVFQQVKQPRTL
jgi:hypothetical protein